MRATKMLEDDLIISEEDEKLMDEVIDDFQEEIEEETEEPLHVYKNTKPKMCERKDFILIDLMSNNCMRLGELMIKMNNITEKLLDVDIDTLTDEEYHRLIKTADDVNKILVQLGTMI